jgi:hypothetical protein
MIRKVYIFNPENDLALANGNENFEPPLAARRLRDDLSLLPLWYADEDSVVLTGFEIPDEWLKKEREALGVNVLWMPVNAFNENRKPGDLFVPWGWSQAICKLWRNNGCPESPENKPDFLSYKKLSHRAFAIEVLNELQRKSLLSEDFQLPQELFSLSEIKDYSGKYFPFILKAPWSGSGRGLFWNTRPQDEKVKQWACPVLQKQGSVIGESIYLKEKDFAMQFFSNGNGVFFTGYSLFMTDKYGAYKGNWLETDHFIEKTLSQSVSFEWLKQVQEELCRFFSTRIAPFYKGYFGVDMMICLHSEKPGVFFLHPCVEVNLRMNMGMTCRLFYDRYVSHVSHGVFQIDYYADSGLLYDDHLKRKLEKPLEIKNGKIRSGYISLSPVNPDTHYRARVEISEK